MVFFKNFIKDKRGVVSVFSLWIIMFSVLFTAFLIDIGLAFYSRVHLQGIADSASMAGAVYGGRSQFSPYDGRPEVFIEKDVADNKARQVIRANEDYILPRSRVTSSEFNPPGTWIDGVFYATSNEQYFDSRDRNNPRAHFTVRLGGQYLTMFFNSEFFGIIPRVNLSVSGRTSIELDR